MWKIINSAISTKSVISLLTKIIENSVIKDSSKIADCFNQFFVEIGKYLNICLNTHLEFIYLNILLKIS